MVTIRDAQGNTVTSATDSVTLTLTTGTGVLSGTTTVAAVGGVATFSGLSINLAGTDKVLTAARTGLTSATTAAFIITANTAASISIAAGNAQTATVNTAVTTPPQVLVVDTFGNPVAGVEVIFAVTANNGIITGATDTTDAAGLASVGSWTLDSIAGEDSLTATSGTLTNSPLLFTATGTADTATTISIAEGDGQSTTAGTDVPDPVRVLVVDAFGNPVSGVSVTFTVTSGGGSVTGNVAVSDANGLATLGSWTLGVVPGTNTLDATSGTLTGSPLTFTATGTLDSSTELAVATASGEQSLTAAHSRPTFRAPVGALPTVSRVINIQ